MHFRLHLQFPLPPSTTIVANFVLYSSQPKQKLWRPYDLIYLEVAFELAGFDSLVWGLRCTSLLYDFLRYRGPLVLVRMFIRPPNQERLSLIGEGTAEVMGNGPHLCVHKCVSKDHLFLYDFLGYSTSCALWQRTITPRSGERTKI